MSDYIIQAHFERCLDEENVTRLKVSIRRERSRVFYPDIIDPHQARQLYRSKRGRLPLRPGDTITIQIYELESSPLVYADKRCVVKMGSHVYMLMPGEMLYHVSSKGIPLSVAQTHLSQQEQSQSL